MSASRSELEKQALQDLKENIIFFYINILSLESNPQLTTLCQQIKDKYTTFLRSFSNADVTFLDEKKAILIGQIKRIAELTNSIDQTIITAIIDTLSSANHEETENRLSILINEKFLMTKIEGMLEIHHQNQPLPSATQPDFSLPISNHLTVTERRRIFKPYTIDQLSDSENLSYIDTQECELLIKKRFAKFLEKLDKLNLSNFRFLVNSTITSIANETTNKIFHYLEPGESLVSANVDNDAKKFIAQFESIADNDIALCTELTNDLCATKGISVLMLACSFGHLKIVNDLILAGERIDDRTFDGKTALYFALRYNQTECAQLLFNASCDVVCSTQDESGLEIAMSNNNIDCIYELLKLGHPVYDSQHLLNYFTTLTHEHRLKDTCLTMANILCVLKELQEEPETLLKRQLTDNLENRFMENHNNHQSSVTIDNLNYLLTNDLMPFYARAINLTTFTSITFDIYEFIGIPLSDISIDTISNFLSLLSKVRTIKLSHNHFQIDLPDLTKHLQIVHDHLNEDEKAEFKHNTESFLIKAIHSKSHINVENAMGKIRLYCSILGSSYINLLSINLEIIQQLIAPILATAEQSSKDKLISSINIHNEKKSTHKRKAEDQLRKDDTDNTNQRSP